MNRDEYFNSIRYMDNTQLIKLNIWLFKITYHHELVIKR